jgi:hypothetical protein
MHAMILEKPRTALQDRDSAMPVPGIGQVRIRVLACAVCRTDLHVVDGELPDPKLPLVPGHEIVGDIVGSPGWAGPVDHASTVGRIERIFVIVQGLLVIRLTGDTQSLQPLKQHSVFACLTDMNLSKPRPSSAPG